MKKLILLAALIAGPAFAQGTVHVDGYFRRDGTYVPPHTRTAPNSSRTDNWSSEPNVNPNTGERGTVDPYKPEWERSSSKRPDWDR